MATIAELITAFRKETEDLIRKNIKDTFKVQYGTLSASSGANSVSFSDAEITYPDTDYEILVYDAKDANNIDLKNALTFSKTTGGFTVTAPRACTIRWQTSLRVPYMEIWT